MLVASIFACRYQMVIFKYVKWRIFVSYHVILPSERTLTHPHRRTKTEERPESAGVTNKAAGLERELEVLTPRETTRAAWLLSWCCYPNTNVAISRLQSAAVKVLYRPP